MLLIQEITELERNIDSGKVDHPDGGSKDASDAVCGAMYNASKHAEEFAYDYGESAEYLLRVNEDYSITEMDKLTLQLEEELKNMGSVFTKNKKPNHPSNVANETRDYYLLTDDIIIL